MFAKILGPDDDQIVGMLSAADDGAPELNLHFKPKGLKMQKMCLKFDASETQWDHAEKMLRELTEVQARELIWGARAQEPQKTGPHF